MPLDDVNARLVLVHGVQYYLHKHEHKHKRKQIIYCKSSIVMCYNINKLTYLLTYLLGFKKERQLS